MTAGQKCADALLKAKREYLRAGKQISWVEVAQIIDDVLSPVKTAPIARKRNELLDALLSACGVDPAQATRTGIRAAAVGLSDIQTVHRGLTAGDLEQRAQSYKRKHPTWPLTPPALAKHWASLGPAISATRTAIEDPYIEPEGWRPVIQKMYDLDDEVVRERTWDSLGTDTRKEILKLIYKK